MTKANTFAIECIRMAPTLIMGHLKQNYVYFYNSDAVVAESGVVFAFLKIEIGRHLTPLPLRSKDRLIIDRIATNGKRGLQ